VAANYQYPFRSFYGHLKKFIQQLITCEESILKILSY